MNFNLNLCLEQIRVEIRGLGDEKNGKKSHASVPLTVSIEYLPPFPLYSSRTVSRRKQLFRHLWTEHKAGREMEATA